MNMPTTFESKKKKLFVWSLLYILISDEEQKKRDKTKRSKSDIVKPTKMRYKFKGNRNFGQTISWIYEKISSYIKWQLQLIVKERKTKISNNHIVKHTITLKLIRFT